MKRQGQWMILCLTLVMTLWSQTGHINAQSLAEYTSAPPTVSNAVTPNVLLLLDKSGSMGRRADCDRSTGGDFTTCPVFVETNTYTGMFDPLKCYIYNGAAKRFQGTTVKGSVSTACGATEWDGNFLNWVTIRRIDAVKQALIGGSCAVARAADGTCPPMGFPPMITLKGVDRDVNPSGATVSTPAVPTGGGAGGGNGRIPSSVQSGLGGTMYLHLIGHDGNLTGYFCVDDDTDAPRETNTDCSGNEVSSGSPDATTYVTPFKVQVAVTAQPKGIIQEAGSKARFGLMEFKGNDGAQVMVPIGARQTIEWNGTTVKTFANNALAMIDAIEETNNEGNTPLAESLYEAIRYVAQVNSSLFPATYVYPLAYSPGVSLGSSGVGSLGGGEITALTGSETCPAGYISSACGRDPFFFGSNHAPAWATPSGQIPCCKTFIIVLTDGEPTQDTTIPAALQDYAHAAHGTHCTGTHGVPFVDPPGSTCNTDPATPNNVLLKQHRTDYGGSGTHYLDDVAYWGHINDLRQNTLPVIGGAGHDLPGLQNVTVYTFFAFGNINGREILMQTAKQGAFVDQNANNLPDLPAEYDQLTNATGTAGADGIPDAYFEGANAGEIRTQLAAAVTAILQQSGAGSAASVLASSATGEGALYQSFFFPSTPEGVKWVGYTQGLFLDAFGNLREDTNGDKKLVYDQDYIVQTRIDVATKEVVVDRYVDANGDGLADTPSTPLGTVKLKDVNNIWEAGNRLALTASGSRKILTWIDKDHDGLVDGAEQIAFTAANATDLDPYLRTGVAPFTATNIINFIRGDQIAGLRDRQLDVGGSPQVWKFGDSIHAQPMVIGPPGQRYDVIYGDSSYTAFFAKYKDRRQVAYVGANDGMLHAFNAGYFHRGDDPATSGVTEHGWFTRTPTDNSSGPLLGDELWGFIPQELLPHLRWLTDPNYTHVYYVDLKPKVTDARIFTPDADHPNGWGTILMGGFRMGGSCGNCASGTGAPAMTVNADFNNDGDTVDADDTRTFYSAYFVLDITNPETDPVLLWSLTSSDLGLTTTVPSMLRVSPSSSSTTDNTDAKWYMIVGSGPTGYDGDAGQVSKLYAIDLAQGPGANNSLVTKFAVGTWNSFMADTVTIDRNFDYRVDVSYEGRVIDDGTPPWRGKLYRLTMNACTATPCSTSTWGIDDGGGNRIPTEILDTFLDSLGNTKELGPIVAAPAVTLDDANKLWVFAGTGRYFGNPDKTNTDQQYFVGVKDSVLNSLCTESSTTNCHTDDLVDVSAAQVCLIGTGTCGTSTDQVTGVTGAADFPSLINLVASKEGWFTTLPTSGERALARPMVLGGIVLFPTFVPDNDACAATGQSYLYALYYMTGSAYSAPVIGTTASGSNKLVNRSTSVGLGLASQAVVHLGKGSTEGSARAFVQKSTGELTSVETNNLGPVVSRFVSWYRQSD